MIRRRTIGFKGQTGSLKAVDREDQLRLEEGAAMAPGQCPVHQLSGTSPCGPCVRLVGLASPETFQSLPSSI